MTASTNATSFQPTASRYPQQISVKKPVGKPHLSEDHPGNRLVSLPTHLKDEALDLALLEFDPHHIPCPTQKRVVSMPEYFISQTSRPSPISPRTVIHAQAPHEELNFRPLIDFSSPCHEGESSAELSRSDLPSDESQGSILDYGPPTTPPQLERTVDLSTDYGQSDASSVIFITDPPARRAPIPSDAFRNHPIKIVKTLEKNNAGAPRSSPVRIATSPGPATTRGVSWGSPPRPIPALHGPPSLPYARCPS
jgi:hypothetical protein